MELNRTAANIPDYVSKERERFRIEVLRGLKKNQKELSPKYFYDKKGALLFDQICTSEEYYIPRVEASIMNMYIDEVVDLIGPEAFLIEYGSGSCNKVRLLLDNLSLPVAYVPIDISRQQLSEASRQLAREYPGIEILPVCADYTGSFELPIPRQAGRRRIIFFPGSTISNFNPSDARLFLENVTRICGMAGGLLIGVDLKKDPVVLHRAYNDSQGITSAFNLHLLERINLELGGDFDIDAFRHYAFYNPNASRIEMHLVSLKEKEVHLGNETITFTTGESIWTESSYKYTCDEFEQLAGSAGFKVRQVWKDERNWFSVQYLTT